MARIKRQYGSGCLIKRGRRWAIRWREMEIAPDGTTRRALRYELLGDVSRKEAADSLAQRVATAGSGRGPIRSRVAFRTFAAEWLAHVMPMYKHSTQRNHRHILDKHLLPRFGDMPLVEVTRQEIQAYMSSLTKAGYAPKTIDHMHDVLSALLRTAVKWGHLTDNPARGVDLPVLRTVRPKWVLTVPQAARLLEALPPLGRTLAGVAMMSGLRRGELFALRWRDVDAARQCLTVCQAVYDGRFDTPKTQAGTRVVPLPDGAIQLLAHWKARGQRTEPDALVFATGKGGPISSNNVARQQIFPACSKLGLERASWLTFRRTYSSWAHANGVPGKVVAQLMGHAKVDTTLNVYTQVVDGALRQAANTIGTGLFAIVRSGDGTTPLTHWKDWLLR